MEGFNGAAKRLGEVIGVFYGGGGGFELSMGAHPTAGGLVAPGPRFCPTLRLWLRAVSASQNLVPGARQRRGGDDSGDTGKGCLLSPCPSVPPWGGER